LQAGFAVPSTRILGDKRSDEDEVDQARRRREKETETDPGLVGRGRRGVVGPELKKRPL